MNGRHHEGNRSRQKNVVEHKEMYLRLGSEALILLRAQSPGWNTLFAKALRIRLAAEYLQSSQWLAWDTLLYSKHPTTFAGFLGISALPERSAD
jgi:hypothetical protein